MSSGDYILASKGNIFVLTKKGYEDSKRLCSEKTLKERAIGKSVGEYTDNVPASWVRNGWVEEIAQE